MLIRILMTRPEIMVGSEEEADLDLPPPKKKRKFAFKKLAQRIAEVDLLYCLKVLKECTFTLPFNKQDVQDLTAAGSAARHKLAFIREDKIHHACYDWGVIADRCRCLPAAAYSEGRATCRDYVLLPGDTWSCFFPFRDRQKTGAVH